MGLNRKPSWWRIFLDNAEELLALALLCVVAGVEATQVVARFVVGDPLSWPEQVATACFVWMTFLGSAGALKRRGHVRVELMERWLSGSDSGWRRHANTAARALVGAVATIFITVLAFEGLQLTLSSNYEISGIGISWRWLYAAVPVSCFCFLLRMVQRSLFGYEFQFVEHFWELNEAIDTDAAIGSEPQ